MTHIRTRMIILMVALGLFTGSVAYAISLAELITDGSTIIQGDKLFSDFSFSLGDATGRVSPVDATGIDIVGITTNGNEGLHISGNFSAFSAPQEGQGQPNLSITIGYRVTSLDQAFRIHDLHLEGRASMTTNAMLFADETATDAVGDLLGRVSVSGIVNFPPPEEIVRTDHVIFSVGVESLFIESIIRLAAIAGSPDCGPAQLGLNCGFIRSASFDQTFSQVAVPEPDLPVVLLSAIVLLGAVAVRVRRLL
jgi:hypothetical protein